MIRLYNGWTRAAPYESIRVADIGDINVNLFDLKDTCKKIREAYREIVATGCIPLTLGEKTFSICINTWIRLSLLLICYLHLSWIPGGDHTIAYPILQAVAERLVQTQEVSLLRCSTNSHLVSNIALSAVQTWSGGPNTCGCPCRH